MEIQVETVTFCTTTLFAKFQCTVTKPERNDVYGKRGESRSFPVCPVPLRHKHRMSGASLPHSYIYACFHSQRQELDGFISLYSNDCSIKMDLKGTGVEKLNWM
jgi:hypothetical protein